MVSTRTTYILWFFFGWTGLHHLYLGRLNHAIVWFFTLGGVCGVGWIRDYWRIPEYIKWCNPDKAMRKKYLQRTVSKLKPEVSGFRYTGMVIMGSFIATVLGALVPDYSEMLETDPITYYVCQCIYGTLHVLGHTIGVYLVANIGELQCSVYYPLISSICAAPLAYMGSPFTIISGSIPAWYTKYKGLHWRHPPAELELRQKGRKNFLTNTCIYLLACLIWLLIVPAGFYLNGSVVDTEGKKKTGRDIFGSAFSSEDWQPLVDSAKKLYNIGWWQVWLELKSYVDISGKINAYKTLSVYPWTSEEEISKRCRKLLALNHPDRLKSKSARDEAEAKFVVIQSACSELSKSRSQKLRDDET